MPGIDPEKLIWTAGEAYSQKSKNEENHCLAARHHSFQLTDVPSRVRRKLQMTWHCGRCQINNGEKQEYCKSCKLHWSQTWKQSSRRSRIKSQTCSSKSQIQLGDNKGFTGRQCRLECFSNECPLDTLNAFKQNCGQEDGCARWRWTDISTTRREGCAASSIRSFYRNLRRGDPRTSQRASKHGDGASGTLGAATRVDKL